MLCLSILGVVCLYFLRNGPSDFVNKLFVIREAGSQPVAATAAIARTSVTYDRSSTLWQQVHSSRRGRREGLSALLCFRPWQFSEMKLLLQALNQAGALSL
jgi:hypothetical protein